MKICGNQCISFFQMLISIRRGGGLLKIVFPFLVATDKKSQIFLLKNVRPQNTSDIVTRSREVKNVDN